MTAPEPAPTAEHIDANPAVQAIRDGSTIAQFLDGARPVTQESLNIAHALRMRATPAVQAALARSLPADVMLAALVRAGVLVRTTITANNATVSILAERIEVAP